MPVGDNEPAHWWRNSYIVVPAVVAILVAIIGGIFTLEARSSGSNAGGNVPSAAISPSSPPTETISSPPQTALQPSPSPSVPAIPLLKPIISQPGWTLAWHQRTSIGPQGIIFGMSGPDVGDGASYDLQYIAGNGNAWNCGRYVNYFSPWSYHYPPGPATLNGVSENLAGCALGQAHVGDRDYAILDTVGFTNRIVYMQVVGVGPESIVADTWVWNKD